METPLAVVFALAVGAALFFWGRGMVRARKGDLVAGCIILAVICGIFYVTATSSAVFSFIGMLVSGFGLATLILSSFASPNCPIRKDIRRTLGVVAILLGLFLQMIL